MEQKDYQEREEQMQSAPEATELLYVQGLTVQHGWREESRKWAQEGAKKRTIGR